MPLDVIQHQHGPFARKSEYPAFGRDYTVTCDGQDRIRMVKESTDPDWLRAVIRDRDVQSTVRLAAERRLRKLVNDQAHAPRI